jgi:uncharacterized protein (DUF1501 family)
MSTESPKPATQPRHYETRYNSRREFLSRAGGGFGMLALSALLQQEGLLADTDPVTPLSPKSPHFPAKAKQIIYLFMHGGPSHIDTFDPKPALIKLDGQKLPPSLQNIRLQFTNAADAPLLASRRKFQKYGQCGMDVSDLFPNVAQHVDDLALIRSCHHEAFVHSMALNLMNTGSIRMGFPSMGSWIVYGLGSESRNLPAYIVMLEGGTKAGPPAYGSGFLPATYQGTVVRTKGEPFLNIKPPAGMTVDEQRDMLDNAKWFDEQHMASRSDDSNLSARIAAYELAFRMQAEAPELVDFSKETEATKKLYGVDDDATREFGTKCLLARRMVERGVRFVQVYSGGLLNGDDWDGHSECDKNHQRMSLRVDKPIAGLLADLKQRGLLESTLVIWGGDFGRTPITDGQLRDGGGYRGGRDHNPYGFSMWMAGGGIKGGKIIGATDEIGFKAIEDPVHTNDIHATILALLGLDHKRLTYFYQGRNFRLTDVGGDNSFVKRLV